MCFIAEFVKNIRTLCKLLFCVQLSFLCQIQRVLLVAASYSFTGFGADVKLTN